jgi:hypothetical protein
VANVIREPLLAPVTKRPTLNVDLIPNLLLTTLAIVAAIPFHQTDWPTPVRARSIPQADIPPNILVRGIPAQPTVPFKNLEQYTQFRARPAQSEIPPNLLATTLKPAQGAPFKQSDWPNPVSARIAPQADSLAGVTTRGIPSLNPFYQTDWPNPVRARIAAQADSLAGVTTRGIPASVLAPFVQSDWPQPARARTTPAADSGPISLALVSAFTGAPFSLYEFPNPQARKYYAQVDATPNLAIFAQALGVPFYQTDWQNPFARKPQRFDDPPNLISSTLKPASTNPFYTVDQSAPVRRIATIFVDPVPNMVLLGIPAQPTLSPFLQSDWPTPMRARYVAAIDGTFNLLIQAQQVAGPLIAIQDWPLVLPRRYAQVEQAPYNLLIQALQQGAPLVALQDWPVIYRPKQIAVETAPNLVIQRLLQTATPFSQQDWPNPAARRATPQGFELSAVGLYLPKPPVLPFSLKDWPQPYRARRGEPSDTVENLLIDIGHPITFFTGSDYWLIAEPARAFKIAQRRIRRFTGISTARTFKVYSNMPTVRFDAKDPSEAVRLTYDMTAQLAALPIPNTVLTGVVSVTIVSVFGGDLVPNLAQNGAAGITASALQAVVPVLGGLAENDYSVRVVMSTTDALTILELTGILPVRS